MVHLLGKLPRNSKYHKERDTFVHFVENILWGGLWLECGNAWRVRNKLQEEHGNWTLLLRWLPKVPWLDWRSWEKNRKPIDDQLYTRLHIMDTIYDYKLLINNEVNIFISSVVRSTKMDWELTLQTWLVKGNKGSSKKPSNYRSALKITIPKKTRDSKDPSNSLTFLNLEWASASLEMPFTVDKLKTYHYLTLMLMVWRSSIKTGSWSKSISKSMILWLPVKLWWNKSQDY